MMMKLANNKLKVVKQRADKKCQRIRSGLFAKAEHIRIVYMQKCFANKVKFDKKKKQLKIAQT